MRLKFIIICSSLLTFHHLILAQCDRANIINDYLINYQPSDFTVNELNWTGNVNNCAVGSFNNNINTKILKRINFLRRICALNDDVIFSTPLNAQCKEAVLMFEKNGTISHCSGANNAPCNSWQCTTSGAISAAQRSNLSFGDWNFNDPIDLYIEEEGTFNNALPHMKWILYSKAKTFGNAVGPTTNVMYIYDNFGNASMNQKQFIAFPPSGFVPASIVKNKWFFAIPNANFSNATVTIKNENGNNLPVIITTRNEPYGDSAVTWIVNNIDTSNTYDVAYTVTVSNITNAPFKSYTYAVIVAQPVHPPPCPANLVWSDNSCNCIIQQSCTQNLTLNNKSLTTATYQVGNQLTIENSTVLTNQKVTFFAKNRISINSNFSTSQGASLKIDIKDCP